MPHTTTCNQCGREYWGWGIEPADPRDRICKPCQNAAAATLPMFKGGEGGGREGGDEERDGGLQDRGGYS